MWNARVGWFGSVALVAALGGSYGPPMVASLIRSGRVVPVRNVDERGRAPYLQFQGQSCHPDGAAICNVVFPPIPAGQRLVLEQVNASINFATGGVRRTALVTPEVGIIVFPVRPTSDADLLIVNESTLTYYENEQAPIFQIVLRDGADTPLITVALSGYLVSLEE